ncbi:unnamed protein product [Vicia faba]|uniref:Transmembrane protein n=1 Tax=Vicia faba TaxID=3906 RepID=A0AAV0ZGN1_VICFA|nr:unnamed protein product [Vicia faba]
MSLELGSIAIKCQGSDTNPFQPSSPSFFLFLIALPCHAVTTMSDLNFPTTMLMFHFTGVVGCETLLWILLPDFWKWYIINLFLLLVTSFCFFDFISSSVTKLLVQAHSNPATADHPLNLESRESQP